MCVMASNTPEETAGALAEMAKVLKAEVRPAAEVDFHALARR